MFINKETHSPGNCQLIFWDMKKKPCLKTEDMKEKNEGGNWDPGHCILVLDKVSPGSKTYPWIIQLCEPINSIFWLSHIRSYVAYTKKNAMWAAKVSTIRKALKNTVQEFQIKQHEWTLAQCSILDDSGSSTTQAKINIFRVFNLVSRK